MASHKEVNLEAASKKASKEASNLQDVVGEDEVFIQKEAPIFVPCHILIIVLCEFIQRLVLQYKVQQVTKKFSE